MTRHATSTLSLSVTRAIFTNAQRPDILAVAHRPSQLSQDTDRAAETGGIGTILRREGLYSSTLTDWRRQREAGTFGALIPGKRGRKTIEVNPLAVELALARRDNARLTQPLTRVEAIIDQKKVAELLGIPLARSDDEP